MISLCGACTREEQGLRKGGPSGFVNVHGAKHAREYFHNLVLCFTGAGEPPIEQRANNGPS